MAKIKTRYVCSNCGSVSSRWLGRCPKCGEWNTMVEETVAPEAPKAAQSMARSGPASQAASLADIAMEDMARMETGIGELDRVLGGGIVPGALILLSGDPGIGKSTLVLQLAAAVCDKNGTVLYGSGEESAGQIKMRAQRLGISTPDLIIQADTSLDHILDEAKKLPFTPFGPDAPFIETDGTTLRWDSRDMTNPLIGSVHDPIYQGARRDLADTGIPEPKPGLVTEAHGGILFIDEIGEVDPMLLNKLLKVMEDKRVRFESAYYDEDDPNVPKYIKKLFAEGAPADFILIGATTRDPSEINPAIRSRCAEIFFEPLIPSDIEQIVTNAAAQLGAELEDGVAKLISEFTIEGRKAVNILADTYGLSVFKSGSKDHVRITCDHVRRVAQISRLVPYVTEKASDTPVVGKVFGLGVAGYLGSAIEIEAVAFPARAPGKGYYRFNDTAGSMAKDSMFNAAAVVRRMTGKELSDYDVNINFVGGGNIDGPSAGCAITTALISAITGKPVRQDMALTGEISIQGQVKPVGGVFEKAYGARQAGMKGIIIPKENAHDIPERHLGLNIHYAVTIDDVLKLMLVEQEGA